MSKRRKSPSRKPPKKRRPASPSGDDSGEGAPAAPPLPPSVAALCTTFLERDVPISRLISAFGQPGDRVPPIVVHGKPTTGKTGVVKSLLKALDLPHVFLDCAGFASGKELLTAAANALPRAGDSASTVFRFLDFRHKLVRACTADDGKLGDTMYWVFDNAETLPTLHSSLVPNLLSLADLPTVNVCPVFLCHAPTRVLPSDRLFAAAMVHFPPLSQGAAVQVLMRAVPTGVTRGAYKEFVSTLWGLFGPTVCGTDLRELQYVARVLWPTYVEFGTTKQPFKDMVGRLRSRMYHRDAGAPLLPVPGASAGAGKETSGIELELPYTTKYLLLAAYVASHNPPETDARFFTRSATGRRKRGRRRKAGTVIAAAGMPRVFPLERLLAIFWSMLSMSQDGKLRVEDEVTEALFSGVASLVSLNLLARDSSLVDLSDVKLRCCVGSEVVRSVAKRVGYGLDKVLYNPDVHT